VIEQLKAEILYMQNLDAVIDWLPKSFEKQIAEYEAVIAKWESAS